MASIAFRSHQLHRLSSQVVAIDVVATVLVLVVGTNRFWYLKPWRFENIKYLDRVDKLNSDILLLLLTVQH